MSIFDKHSVIGCILAVGLFSNNASADDCCECAGNEIRVEAKAGYFIFKNSKMRDVYDNGGFEIQLSGSYHLLDVWHLYGSVGYLQACGKSMNFHEKTKIWQIPVDIGLKPIVALTPCMDWFMAIGPRFFYVHQRNHSDYVSKNVEKGNIGMFVNSGIDFTPACNYYINLFGEYSYQPIRPSSSKDGVHSKTIQIGGFTVGVGFGYTL